MDADVELQISSVAYGGVGIAKNLGKIVMIPDVLPGEVILGRIIAESKAYSRAVVKAVLQPSPHRIEGDCIIHSGLSMASGSSVPARVPGCVYQCFSYPEELRVKNLQLSDFLKDICELSADPRPSPCHLNYRNKITLHVQDDMGMV
ncbi:MAG: hypothetical protein JW808_06495, partial [Victivallales bacterium]|nr:hypothetical protein [Victivallales bacterium]